MARENQQHLDAEPKHAVPDHVSKRDTQSGKEHENPVSGLLPIEGNTRNDMRHGAAAPIFYGRASRKPLRMQGAYTSEIELGMFRLVQSQSPMRIV